MEYNETNNPKENTSKPNDENQPKIEITVRRHKQLFELLQDPVRMWRVLLSFFLLIVILFIGLAFVVLTIKKFYPYNMIETNIQGASIVKSEDKDVIYWLFNTADLWANSGIEVQEGDVLTIRASGSSYTAIHHLVDASQNNYAPNDKWVGTEGLEYFRTTRDSYSKKYRLCPENPEGILLMKIINPKSVNDKPLKSWDDTLLTKDIEVIGKERTLYISRPGVLHFAVNDIVLTNCTLDSMYEDYINSIDKIWINQKDGKRACIDTFKSIDEKDSLNNLVCVAFLKEMNNSCKVNAEEAKKIGLSPGRYPVDKKEDKDHYSNNDSIYYNAYPLVNEYVYYKQYKFVDAWYLDNLGSFLIVIERKRR